VDSSGAACIVGQTGSKDFPVTAGAFQTTMPGSRTSFVARLNPAGSRLAYATYLGGISSVSYLCCDAATAVAIDSAGDAYVAGTTYASGFPVTQGAVQTKLASSLASNAYVAKLNPSGSSLVYATFLGGAGQVQFNIGPAVFAGDVATALAVDRTGNAYVTGYAHSADFPVTAGAFQTRNKAATTSGTASQIPGYNAFVTKINPSGSALVFSTYLGGSGVSVPNGSLGNAKVFGDQANALSVDNAGNVYVAGSAYSADFPVTAGAYQTKLQAAQPTPPLVNFSKIGFNAFVTKLNSAGSNLVYSTFVGGSGADRANAMAIDASGNASIAGATTSLDFPVVAGAVQSANKAAVASNASSAFVTQLNSSGTSLTYSTLLGGTAAVNSLGQPMGDTAYGLTLDAAANVYVAGTTSSADFPATQGAFQTTNNAAASTGQNAFVALLNPGAPLTGDPPSIRPNLGVVDSVNYAPVLTPGGLATIFGYSLANTSTSAASLPLSNSLRGTRVTIGGVPAPLLYVSPSQINLQVPWELAGQSQAAIAVTTSFGVSSARTAALTVNLAPAAPAVFTANATGSGQAVVFTLQGPLAVPATPATRGQYVMIYCSGLGPVSNQPATGAAAVDASSITIQPPSVTIGGVQAPVSFSGLAPGFPGLYQVNITVPAGVAAGTPAITVAIGGQTSKASTLPLK